MVIINADYQGCPQSSSDKRAGRIRRRRNEGIYNSTLDRALRNAHSANELSLDSFSDVNYARLFRHTKHFFRCSYNRLRDFTAYLSGQGDYCANCSKYQQLLDDQRAAHASLLLTESSNFATQHRFSNTFVEKVQSQQDAMPSCTCDRCQRRYPPVEYYCQCEGGPRKIVYSPAYPTGQRYRQWQPPKRKKSKHWWCCRKRNEPNCAYPSRMNRCMYDMQCGFPEKPSMLQKMKCYMNGKTCHEMNEADLYNAYVDELSVDSGTRYGCCSRRQRAKDRRCDNGGYRRERDCPMHPRPNHVCGYESSEECEYSTKHEAAEPKRKQVYSDDDYDEDSDDCCCCCPCRKDLKSLDVQTEGAVYNNKHIDTQTDIRCKRPRRCCRCCRNACVKCQEQTHRRGNRNTTNNNNAEKEEAPDKDKEKEKEKEACSCVRPACEMRDFHPQCYYSINQPPPAPACRHKRRSSGSKCCSRKSGRRRDDCRKPARTIICRATGTQHSPVVDSLAECQYDSFRPCRQMHDVMFTSTHAPPLFMDKVFSSPVSGKTYRISPLQPPFIPPPPAASEDILSMSEASLPPRSKKRFLNAVCDTILHDLSHGKRRNSLSDILRSPDSGFQESLAIKKPSLFAFKRSHHHTSRAQIAKLLSRRSRPNLEDSSDGAQDSSILSKASKVVRGILEEISKKDETHLASDTSDLMQRPSLQELLQGGGAPPPKRSHSDSALVDTEWPPAASEPVASTSSSSTHAAKSGESYTKLLKAIGSLRSNKTAKL